MKANITQPVWEIMFPGFDGSTDETDHLVKWILAPSLRLVCDVVKPEYFFLKVHKVEASNIRHVDIDYVLPRDNDKLVADLAKAHAITIQDFARSYDCD